MRTATAAAAVHSKMRTSRLRAGSAPVAASDAAHAPKPRVINNPFDPLAYSEIMCRAKPSPGLRKCSATTMITKTSAPEYATNLRGVTSGDLIETFRAEAMALFSANQSARLAAQRLGIFIVVFIGIGVGAALLADDQHVVVALPPVVFVLSAMMFQQFAEVSVTGAAREVLEERLADLGVPGLIYERAVAGIRKRPPLVTSVRALQVLLGSGAIALTVVAAVFAFDDHHHWTLAVAYLAVTLPTLAVAATSYLHMLRSGGVARDSLLHLFDVG